MITRDPATNCRAILGAVINIAEVAKNVIRDDGRVSPFEAAMLATDLIALAALATATAAQLRTRTLVIMASAMSA